MNHARRICCAALALLVASTLQGQEEDAVVLARSRAVDARARCVTLLEGVEGVTSVNYGGTGTSYRLMVIVRDYTAKLAAQKKTGGDVWEGLPIHWTVTRATYTTPTTTTIASPPEGIPAGAPPRAPEPTPPATNPQNPQPSPEVPDCDIVRAQLGLPPLRRPVGGSSWKSWIPCKVWLRAVQGPGGGHSYLHTKHRPGCPFQDGLISPVYREGFLYPTELRGSDSSWVRQVYQDLDGKFPPQAPPMQPKTGPARREVPTGQ